MLGGLPSSVHTDNRRTHATQMWRRGGTQMPPPARRQHPATWQTPHWAAGRVYLTTHLFVCVRFGGTISGPLFIIISSGGKLKPCGGCVSPSNESQGSVFNVRLWPAGRRPPLVLGVYNYKSTTAGAVWHDRRTQLCTHRNTGRLWCTCK